MTKEVSAEYLPFEKLKAKSRQKLEVKYLLYGGERTEETIGLGL